MKANRLDKSYLKLMEHLETSMELHEKAEAELKKCKEERDNTVKKLSDATG